MLGASQPPWKTSSMKLDAYKDVYQGRVAVSAWCGDYLSMVRCYHLVVSSNDDGEYRRDRFSFVISE